MELFKRQAGIDLTHVLPGGAPVQDLLGGRIPVFLDLAAGARRSGREAQGAGGRFPKRIAALQLWRP
jgi:hypothetical protein